MNIADDASLVAAGVLMMLSLLTFALFAAALTAVIVVMASTLVPALPRIASLFDEESTARLASRNPSLRLAPVVRQAPSAWRAAA